MKQNKTKQYTQYNTSFQGFPQKGKVKQQAQAKQTVHKDKRLSQVN